VVLDRPEQDDRRHAYTTVDAKPHLVLSVGLLQRVRAGDAAGDPATTERGVTVGLESEDAVADHDV
jgi:hypothetical protein